jgi:hypothetical protein
MTLLIKQTGLDDYLDGGSGRIKCLIMGPPGSGKTVHSAQFPRPLLADCEEGRMSVAAMHIPYVAIQSVATMKELLTMAELEAKRPLDQQRFQTLIIDTLDSYQRLVIQEYLKAERKPAMSGWQDWGHLDAEMTELVSRLNLLSMNVVCNLHIKETKVGENDDGDGGYLVKGPKLKGDLREQIGAEFDLVGYIETGWEAVDGKRVLRRYIQWGASPDKPLAKDRSRVLPDRTPVTGTSEDFQVLQRPLLAALHELNKGEVIMEVATPPETPDVTAEPVVKGGPVPGSAETGAKPAPRKAAAAVAKKPAAAPPGVAPAPAVVTPPPPAAKPLPTPVAVPVTTEEAIATVGEVLGGTVVPDAPVASSAATAVDVDPTTPVANGDVAEAATLQTQAAILTTADLAVEPGLPVPTVEVPANHLEVSCGDRRFIDVEATPWPNGFQPCGQEMVLVSDGNRITQVLKPEGQRSDLVEIGALKTRAVLCNPCFAAHRNASRPTPKESVNA